MRVVDGEERRWIRGWLIADFNCGGALGHGDLLPGVFFRGRGSQWEWAAGPGVGMPRLMVGTWVDSRYTCQLRCKVCVVVGLVVL
jgi:hypothetical protein